MKASGSERPKVARSDAEWRDGLRPSSIMVTRRHGTERAFTEPHWNEKDEGL